MVFKNDNKPRCYITMKCLPRGEVQVEGVNVDGTHMFSFTSHGLDLAQVHDKARGYVPTGYIPVFKMPQPST